MTVKGVPSVIEIFPRYAGGLLRLRRASHIWVLCWLHKSERKTLQTVPRKISSSLERRGVFSSRSPDRPNPVSISCARVVSIKGRMLEVDSLDAIHGTPVIDLKAYSQGIDSVPSAAQPDFTRKYSLVNDDFLRATLERIARNSCGRLNRDGRAAVELVFNYIRTSGRPPDSRVRILTNLKGDGIDALYALFNLKPSASPVKMSGPAGPPYRIKVMAGREKICVSTDG